MRPSLYENTDRSVNAMEYLSHEVRKERMISRQAFHSGCCNVVLTDGSVKGRE